MDRENDKGIDLSFVKNEMTDDEKTQFLFEEAINSANELDAMLKKMGGNAEKRINEKLSTGNCFIKDDILFIREKDGDRAIWFPTGNAVEYQVEHGLVSPSLLDAKNKLQALINSEPPKLKKED